VDDDDLHFTVTRDNVLVVRNTSGSAMTAGQVVYVTGSTGNVPNVGLAKADSVTTLPAVGILMADAANNAFVMCMMTGIFTMDTSAFSTGDRLFVSATTAGALTNTRPISPLYAQRMGSVLVDGVGNGSLDVTTAPFIGGEESGTTAATYYMPSDHVMDWAAGDITLTHSAGVLAFAGGSYSFAGDVTISAAGILNANNISFNGGGAVETTFSITVPQATTTNDGDNILIRAGAAGPGAGGSAGVRRRQAGESPESRCPMNPTSQPACRGEGRRIVSVQRVGVDIQSIVRGRGVIRLIHVRRVVIMAGRGERPVQSAA